MEAIYEQIEMFVLSTDNYGSFNEYLNRLIKSHFEQFGELLS